MICPVQGYVVVTKVKSYSVAGEDAKVIFSPSRPFLFEAFAVALHYQHIYNRHDHHVRRKCDAAMWGVTLGA